MLPKELSAVFRRHPDAKKKFLRLSNSHQREYIEYVSEAKKEETRVKRADKVVTMVTGKKFNSVYKPQSIPGVLGLKEDMKVKLVNIPDNYDEIMNGYDFKNIAEGSSKRLDFSHIFVESEAQLRKEVPIIRKQINQDGMIWISWYKKSSGIKTDVTEDVIREVALDNKLVDVKVCAVSDVWSGLKLVIPLKYRVS